MLEAELQDEEGQRQTAAVNQFSPLYLRIRYVVRRPLVGCNVCVWLAFRGTVLFCSFDTDEDAKLLRRRDPGLYEALIPLPMEMLKAGSYSIGLNSGVINNAASRADHQSFESLLTFEVGETFDTSLKSFNPHRPGVFALRFDWNTRLRQSALNGAVEHPAPCDAS